jgi:hypothetical protein
MGSLSLVGEGTLRIRLLFMSKLPDMLFGLVPSRLTVFSMAATLAAKLAFSAATEAYLLPMVESVSFIGDTLSCYLRREFSSPVMH